jgi:hypothetical protein
MVDFGTIVMLGFWFEGFTTINRVIEGRFMTSADVGFMNMLTITKSVDVGLFSIPVPNLDFVSGLLRLVKWDYSFFGGNAQMIQFFLYAFTFAVAFSLFITIIGLLYNYFSRSR